MPQAVVGEDTGVLSVAPHTIVYTQVKVGEKGDMVGVLVHTLYISDCVPKLRHQVVASPPRGIIALARSCLSPRKN